MGIMTLELHYRTPKLDAIIELDREDAAAMGAYLVSEFSLSKGAARRRLEDALNGLAPGAAEAAKAGEDAADKFVSQLAGVGAAGVGESLAPHMSRWLERITEGFAGARPNVTNITNVSQQPERPPYWRRVWNAVRGR